MSSPCYPFFNYQRWQTLFDLSLVRYSALHIPNHFTTCKDLPGCRLPELCFTRNVRRNAKRFPEDFMFQLTKGEDESLRFQIGMSKTKWRGVRRCLPYVVTEQGVAGNIKNL